MKKRKATAHDSWYFGGGDPPRWFNAALRVNVGDLVKYLSRTVLVVGWANSAGTRIPCRKGAAWLRGMEIGTEQIRLYAISECEVINESR